MEESTEPISFQICFYGRGEWATRVNFILLTNYLMIIEP